MYSKWKRSKSLKCYSLKEGNDALKQKCTIPMTMYAIQFTMNQNKRKETKKRNNKAVCVMMHLVFFQNFCNAIHLYYYTKRCESVLGTILRFCFYIKRDYKWVSIWWMIWLWDTSKWLRNFQELILSNEICNYCH